LPHELGELICISRQALRIAEAAYLRPDAPILIYNPDPGVRPI
jgi:hypothetical protein